MAPGAMESVGAWADDTNDRIDERVDAARGEFDKRFADVDGFDLGGETTDYHLMRAARLMGGAMITILLIAVVLNEVFSAVNVGSGPFSQIGTDLETTGVAAIGLLVVGLIVLAANRLMSIFGGQGGL